jgi:MoaA/NifB/PqqE/SkfB family radical SAM enzyme
MMGSRLDSIKQIVTDGGPGFCQFAINNACNAGCAFCSFNLETLPKSQWLFAPLEKSIAAINILARHGIRYLVITGGEPMLPRNSMPSSVMPVGVGWL